MNFIPFARHLRAFTDAPNTRRPIRRRFAKRHIKRQQHGRDASSGDQDIYASYTTEKIDTGLKSRWLRLRAMIVERDPGSEIEVNMM